MKENQLRNKGMILGMLLAVLFFCYPSGLFANDEGAFEYIVTTPNGKKATKGKIHVTLQGSPK
jgi:hypothetical protein